MEDKKPLSMTTILMWILGGLWAITSFMATTSYTEIKTDVKSNSESVTEHKKDIEAIVKEPVVLTK